MKLSPFKLERYFAQHEFSARFLLSSSDCESVSIQEILELEHGSAERFQRQWLGYTEAKGHLRLRAEVCGLYSTISPDNVLVQSGAEEPIFLFMNALLETGDEVIVHHPCYQALIEIPKAIGCKVIAWTAREERGWALDIEELKSLVTSKTRCIVINVPHNPTGFLMSKTHLLELSRLAEQNGIVLLCDEVYRESEYRAEDRLPAGCDLGEHAVSIGVLSKTYGLAGLRIGWIATRNAPLLAKVAELRDYTTICNSAPSEFLGLIALRYRKALASRNIAIIRENLGLLDRFFKNHADRFSWQRPQAGPVAFPKLNVGSADDFCRGIIENAGIMILPGSVFGDYSRHFRVGFGRKNLPEALAHLESYLRSPR